MSASSLIQFIARPFPSRSRPELFRPSPLLLLLLLLPPFLASCKYKESPRLGPFHQISNYYVVTQPLPADIRRVAMLPLTSALDDRASVEGRAALQPIVFGEFAKSRLFETVVVPPQALEAWTGRRAWRQDDALPPEFLDKIRAETACDAVLFTQLTHYQPYPPLAVGWRFLLVRVSDGLLVWGFDEVFDAGQPAVINSARRYALDHDRTSPQLAKNPGLLNSPRDFAQFSAHAAVKTLMIPPTP